MKLLALMCPSCGAPLKAEDEDIVIMCRTCQSASHITDDGLTLHRVRFLEPEANSQPTHWLPVWTYLGRVNLQRERQGGSRSAEREAEQFWSEPRRLFVPAWNLSPLAASRIGQELVEQQPVYHPIDAPPDAYMSPVTFPLEDASKLLELIVISMEAERRDYLKTINVYFDLGDPALWAIPGRGQGDSWQLLARRQ